jgi:hypothetical protein
LDESAQRTARLFEHRMLASSESASQSHVARTQYG